MNRVERRLLPAASRIWPELAELNDVDRQQTALTLAVLLYAVPLALAGLVWLALVTDLSIIVRQWPLMLALLAFMLAFRQFYLFITVEMQPGVYGTTISSIEQIVGWSAALLFGPTVLWLVVLSDVLRAAMQRERGASRVDQLRSARDTLISITTGTLPRLVALAAYSAWGGRLPLPGLTPEALIPALAATFVSILATTALFMPMLVMYLSATNQLSRERRPRRTLTRTLVMWFGLAYLAEPLGVVLAGLYVENGPLLYFFLMTLVLIANVIGSRLSFAVEHNRQRTRELEQLEQLARAMLAAPFDGSTLSGLLQEYVPGMFSHSLVEIRLFHGEQLVRHPPDWDGVDPAVWRFMQTSTRTHRLPGGSRVPWAAEPLSRHTLLLPIVDATGQEPLGGMVIARHPSQGDLDSVFPAAHALAAQVASALHSAEVYRETLEHQRTAHELEIAGNIQASFLPTAPPELEGWQLAATLVSARETSGDFFDLVPLWDGRLGIVIADVADKGVGAALYMALARTLLRTYLTEYSTRYPDNYAFHPERVLNTTNQCILQDTHSDLFVTVFLGILDPKLCTLTYANAGHNPPLLAAHTPETGGVALRGLVNTGIPLGVLPDAAWERGSVGFGPGDLLVMYTDGITEARNAQHEFFEASRLQHIVRAHADRPAHAVRQVILDETLAFIGGAPQSDDITLLVLRREPTAADPA